MLHICILIYIYIYPTPAKVDDIMAQHLYLYKAIILHILGVQVYVHKKPSASVWFGAKPRGLVVH